MTLIKFAAGIREDVAELLKLARERWDQMPEIKEDKQIWWDNQVVMQKLHISASTLKRRRHQGIIPYTRNGGKLYYKPSDIEEALASRLN